MAYIEKKIAPIFNKIEISEMNFQDPETLQGLVNCKEEHPTCGNLYELVRLVHEAKITRKITKVIFHCTASQPEATVTAILNYWKKSLGWKNPGYHILVRADGSWTQLLDFNLVSNGVLGHNANSIHISYIGGIDKAGKPKDTRTPEQKAVFETLHRLFKMKLPNATHHGHREFANKACPSFDVQQWVKTM